MKSVSILVGVLVFICALSACHTDTGLGNHDSDYLKDDQSVQPMSVPANLHMVPNGNTRYGVIQPVPDNLKNVSISPPGSLLSESETESQ